MSLEQQDTDTSAQDSLSSTEALVNVIDSLNSQWAEILQEFAALQEELHEDEARMPTRAQDPDSSSD
jgi:hypothetical protein